MKCAVNGVTLHIIRRANRRSEDIGRPALILLHYFGGSSRSWDQVINLLADEHTCIAPDLRGFGNSASFGPRTTNFTLKDYADDIAALVEHLEIKRYALIGHSMGGKVALKLASCQPPHLHSLILLAPSPPTPEPISDADRTRLLATHGDAPAAEEILCKATAHSLPDSLRDLFLEDNLRASQEAWRAWLEHESRADISSSMTNIAVPTLVVSGAADEVLETSLIEREVVQRIGGARLFVVPDAGHLLPLESPSAVADLIREQINSTTP